MSQPPVPYDRIFNFETFSTTNPTVQQPGVQIDGEFDALKITVDSLISRLSEIQRSDGKLNPQAFESTGIPESIASSAYSQVYAQLQPLVLAASQSASASASSASTAGNHANAAQSSAASANAAIAPAVAAKDVAVTKAAEAQAWAVQANASASTAASAEVEAQTYKQQTLDARDEAQQALSSINILKASLDSQYDNMLDADQNLSDVSSKGQSVTNLGLNSSDSSDRAIYNRFKSMFHMYVDPNAGSQSYLSADQYLQGMFGLTFNESTGLFVRSSVGGSYFGEEVIAGNGTAEDVTAGNKTLQQRVEVLKIRMSVISSILRTTMHRISKHWGYNGDNRIVTLQDFQDNPCNNLGYLIWMMMANNVGEAINYQFEIRDAPSNGKQYARQNLSWTEIVTSNGLSEYDNFKVYNANDVVWLGSFIYRFNAFIGAAGYGPVTHPAAWTKLSASEISDINGLQASLDSKAASAHTHSISNISNLQSSLDSKAASVHTHAIADVSNLQASLDGKAASSHTHTIANITNLQTTLDSKASTSALTTGLAGKANTTHTHTITNVTGLQTALDGKSPTSHTHDVLTLSNVNKLQRSTLPVLYQSYQQEWTVTSPGNLHVLDYASDGNGKVTFGNPWYNYGERYFFYQQTSASYPIRFTNAINIDGKTFTRGPNSYVEAISTPDGWLVTGDLMFPPSGTLLSSSCDYVENVADAQAVSWSGNFYSNNTYADGNGGTYSSGGYNQNGCWYPYGFCIQAGVTLSESTLPWSGCSNSGTYTYGVGYGNIRADGYGSTYQEYTGGWSANYGDVIYDSGSGCVVRYDGMGGYYVEDMNGGDGYPSYGTYIGYFEGNLETVIEGETFTTGYWSEERYADGSGNYYVQNYNASYFYYGYYLGYSNYYLASVYSDGNGSYYLYY